MPAADTTFGSTGVVLRKARRALLAQCGSALPRLGAREAQEFEAERGIEDRACGTQPVVERIFGAADRARRAFGEPNRNVERTRGELLVRHRERNEPDALGLLAGERLAQQQVIFGLGHAAEKRPDDCRMIARRDADLGVAIDQLGRTCRDGDVGEDREHEPRTHCRAVDRGNDRLAAVDQVVDQVARLAMDAHADLVVRHHGVEHVEVSAGRERLAGAGQQHRAHARVGVDHAPDLDQLGMHREIGGVELLGPVHHHAHDPRMRPVDQQPRKMRVAIFHRSISVPASRRRYASSTVLNSAGTMISSSSQSSE